MGAKADRIAELERLLELARQAHGDDVRELAAKVALLEQEHARFDGIQDKVEQLSAERRQLTRELEEMLELAVQSDKQKKEQHSTRVAELEAQLAARNVELGEARGQLAQLHREIEEHVAGPLSRRGAWVSGEDDHTLARARIVEAGAHLEVARHPPEAALAKENERLRKELERITTS